MLDKLTAMIHGGKTKATFIIPNAKQGLMNILYNEAAIKTVEYGADAVTVEAVVDARVYGMLAIYE